MKKFISLAVLLVFTVQMALSQVSVSVKKFDNIYKNVKSEFAPDRRVKTFEARLEIGSDSTIVLKGSTTEKEAKEALLKQLADNKIFVSDKMVILPDPELGNKIYGITSQSVINFRYGPDYSEESATQTILGTPVRILEKNGGWLRTVTPEGYIAWVSSASIQALNEKEYNNWKIAERLIITKHYVLFREEPSNNSQIVMDGVWGSIVIKNEEDGDWYKVNLPNGKKAYVAKTDAMDFNKWLETRAISPETLVATAKQFLGFPYMWGGTSVKAVDCSGFTKTVHFLNGVILERDASQQALTGEGVDISLNYNNLKIGDLLFFGSKATQVKKERITHVGIYIGRGEFIHSSGTVRINSLFESSPNYSDVEKKLVRAQRILNKIDYDEGIVSIKKHPWYF